MRKNGFVVMWQLMKLVTPLAHIMSFTIIMGTLGFLSAIFIMVLGAMGLSELLNFHSHLNFDRTYCAGGSAWHFALFGTNVRPLHRLQIIGVVA